jgi:hypothetical protein
MCAIELNLTICLFQENKSYGVETICIDPLSTCCCTSRREHFHRNVRRDFSPNIENISSDMGKYIFSSFEEVLPEVG